MLMTDFLRMVDKLTVAMNKGQLMEFIHNEARILNESEREEFLTRLNEFANPFAEKTTTNAPDEMIGNLSALYKKLDLIKSGEVALTSEYNEEYDDWYNDEADPYIYYDPEHITDTVVSACQMIHTLIDWGKYDEALKLSRTLLELNIDVESEYDEDETFSFGNLFDYELISADYEKIVLDMLLAAYMALPLPECAETVYDFIKLSKCSNINLEKLMQHTARELPHIPEFLDSWIEHLCNQSGNLAEFLLREVVAMITDNEKLLRYAEKYSNTHPCIYDALIEKNSFPDIKETVQIGMKALKIIPTQYAIRSNIALMTAKHALTSDDIKGAEYCWLEAFRSDPTATNLLRLMTMYRNFANIEQEVRTIISADNKDGKRRYSDISENPQEVVSYLISDADRYRLLFLLGDYMDVLDKGMKRMTTLGWSGTFLKCGIPLFFLLMYNHTYLDKAMMTMCKTAMGYMSFRAEDYCRGTQLNPPDNSDEALFWKLFRQTRCPEKPSDEEQKKIMEQLADLTDLRTNLIVYGTRRKYYDECAAYIAALGEVKESHGEAGAKQFILSFYKTQYPRHSAFIRELQNFGLK